MDNGIDQKLIWKVDQGELLEIKIGDIIWIPKNRQDNKKPIRKKANIKGMPKEHDIIRWMRKTVPIEGTFTREDFYKEYPKHKARKQYRDRDQQAIEIMVRTGVIAQYKGNDSWMRIR